MKKLAVAAVFLLMMSANAFAIMDVSGRIARIYTNESFVYFSLKGDACAQPIGVYYYFKLDSDVKKTWFTMLLAAGNTDKPVNVSIANCPSVGTSVEIRYLFQDF